MYGRNGRIGIVVLESDLTIEPDLRRLLPDGVEIHAARVPYPGVVTAENMEVAAECAVNALEQLLPVRPAALAWACTSGSFFAGREGNRQLLKKLASAAQGVPVTTASTALAEAMRLLGAKKPSVGTPYSPDMSQRLVAYLNEYGIKVVHVESMHAGETEDYALQDIEEERVADFIRSLDHIDCDSVVVSCTGLPTARIADVVEAELGKPVITSNTALLWHCWSLGGIGGKPASACRLFDVLNVEERVADEHR